MDPRRMKETYSRLELLDERLTHKLHTRGGSMVRPSVEQLDDRMRTLIEFTVELKSIVHDLIVAIGSRPSTPKPPTETA